MVLQTARQPDRQNSYGHATTAAESDPQGGMILAIGAALGAFALWLLSAALWWGSRRRSPAAQAPQQRRHDSGGNKAGAGG